MTVLINFKICDNVPECGGITTCPFGAFYFDDVEQSIKVDHDKCTNCGKCAKSCLVWAIRFAKTIQQQQQIQEEIDNDPRTIEDLFVDRYGGAPISTKTTIKSWEFQKYILNSKWIVVLELYSDETIECLIRSIPIKDILPEDVKYYKMSADQEISKKYNIAVFPSLLFWKDWNYIDKIEWFRDVSKEKEFKGLVAGVLSKLAA